MYVAPLPSSFVIADPSTSILGDFRELLEKPKPTATNEFDAIIMDSDF